MATSGVEQKGNTIAQPVVATTSTAVAVIEEVSAQYIIGRWKCAWTTYTHHSGTQSRENSGSACIEVKGDSEHGALKAYRTPLRDLIVSKLTHADRESKRFEVGTPIFLKTLLFDLRFCDAESAGDLVSHRVIFTG